MEKEVVLLHMDFKINVKTIRKLPWRIELLEEKYGK